jgi:hypothetical protein
MWEANLFLSVDIAHVDPFIWSTLLKLVIEMFSLSLRFTKTVISTHKSLHRPSTTIHLKSVLSDFSYLLTQLNFFMPFILT